jgi:hypothetical protein
VSSREYNFEDELIFSQGHSATESVQDILLAEIPGAVSCRKSEKHEDKNGTDWWVNRRSVRPLSVDCKIRKEDWSMKPPAFADDLALETFSVIETGAIGWTRNPAKETDYILWLWLDTRRWCLLPFPLLCGVFYERWEEWRKEYGAKRQKSSGWGYSQGTWHSECVFVPRRIVWREIYLRYSGQGQKAA